MKTIQELITEGMEIRKSCTSVAIIPIVSGEVYEGWLTYCERLLNHQFPDDPQTIEFSEISRRANGNDAKLLDRLIGILKAFWTYRLYHPRKISMKFLKKYVRISTDVRVQF